MHRSALSDKIKTPGSAGPVQLIPGSASAGFPGQRAPSQDYVQ